MAERVVPVLKVKNEEYWIEAVLRPLAAVFEMVIMGDTGSTDDTVRIARQFRNVDVIEMGVLTPPELGLARGVLGTLAANAGADWCFLVDGDELYCTETARWIAQKLAGRPPADGHRCGFTTVQTVDGEWSPAPAPPSPPAPLPDAVYRSQERGELWLLDDRHNRNAFFPAGDTWRGAYPFESPAVYDRPDDYFWLDAPPGFAFHAVHLHRLPRSRHDDRVYMRQQKQFQFCLADRVIPRIERFDLAGWLQR